MERVPASEHTRIATNLVPQVSKPAVSPISKSAACAAGRRVRTPHGSQVWKPAIQQTWKSAVRPRRLPWNGESSHAKVSSCISPQRGSMLLTSAATKFLSVCICVLPWLRSRSTGIGPWRIGGRAAIFHFPCNVSPRELYIQMGKRMKPGRPGALFQRKSSGQLSNMI